jgi:uncharacterized protein YvpB
MNNFVFVEFGDIHLIEIIELLQVFIKKAPLAIICTDSYNSRDSIMQMRYHRGCLDRIYSIHTYLSAEVT